MYAVRVSGMKLQQTTHGLRYVAYLTEEEAEIIRARRFAGQSRIDCRPKCRYGGCLARTTDKSGICGIHRRMRDRWAANGFEKDWQKYVEHRVSE